MTQQSSWNKKPQKHLSWQKAIADDKAAKTHTTHGNKNAKKQKKLKKPKKI